MDGLKLFDVVALTEDLPHEKLYRGQVGTVVEIYHNGDGCEVEFIDRTGRTYALLGLDARQLMLLHHEQVSGK